MLEEQKKFKSILKDRQAELAAGLKKLDDIAIDPRPDPLEEVQQAAELNLAIDKHDRESRQLYLVQLALQRIDLGIFGLCTRCEQQISPKRLEAIPWASFCISCQENEDRREKAEDPVRNFFIAAKNGQATA